MVAPANRHISQITTAPPPYELGLGAAPLPRISIFMSVFDCHINRSPVAGPSRRSSTSRASSSTPISTKPSLDNERNSLVIATAGSRVAVVQIAGLVARRIVCFVREGQPVGAGERFGMIRFGSRLDVYLPDGVAPLVAVGQTAIAGETVLADLRSCRRRARISERLAHDPEKWEPICRIMRKQIVNEAKICFRVPRRASPQESILTPWCFRRSIRPRRPARRRFRPIPVRMLLPNLITFLALSPG